jgi:adenosylmethionine-8-amino-7-oxononanoate aminotransferase
MQDLLILGTDTDAGKTTCALLWMSAFADHYEYWKPVETGPSDTDLVAKLVPSATVHPPRQRFEAAVSPPLAAQLQRDTVQSADEIAGNKPTPTHGEKRLLIESFGSAFSPLNDDALQLTLIKALDSRCILVASSALGAIGRTLQGLDALRNRGIAPDAVVLIGRRDDNAAQTIGDYGRLRVFSLDQPLAWNVNGVGRCARTQHKTLEDIRCCVEASSAVVRIDVPDLLAGDRANVWHPYTSLGEPDASLLCVGAQDEFLHLPDGRRVIDAISSWWTILHGHRHPPLMQALALAAARIDHALFAGMTHPWAVKLAERLLRPFPWRGGRVFYSDNGSTAVEVALKMAYQFWCQRGEPRRTRFVGFERGYHGDTFGAMAVSRDPLFFGRFEPLLFDADILPLEPTRLDEHLTRLRGQVAATIIEPLVQGAGGMRMHSPQLLREIAEVTHRHDVLLIADEVMTGGGRTGTLWAHQAAAIVPDLVCAAKTLAGGVLPLAATLVAPPIVNAFATDDRRQTFFHGHSFTAHPLACAVAVANFDLATSDTFQAPLTMARFWQEALAPLRAEPGVKDVRICGSIAAVELDVDGGYLADAGRKMRHKALEMDVLLRPLGSVLYAMPPFCTSPESLRRIAEAMRAAVKAAVS